MANASSRRKYAWALGRDLGNFAAAGLVDDVAGWEARIVAATVAAGILDTEAERQVKSGIKAGLAESWPGFSDTAEWADWKAKRGAAPAGLRRAEAPPPAPPPPPSSASALKRVGDLLSAVLGRLSPRLPAPSPEPPPEPPPEPTAAAAPVCEPEVIPAPGPLEAPPADPPLWRWCWRALGLDLAAAEWWAVRPGEPFAGDPESYEAAINVEHLPEGAVVTVVTPDEPEVRCAVLYNVCDGQAVLMDLTPAGTWDGWAVHAAEVRGWCGAVLRPEDGAASVAALGALAALVAA